MEKLRFACADITGVLNTFPVTLQQVFPDVHAWYSQLQSGTKDFIFELQAEVYQMLSEAGYLMEPTTEDDSGFVSVYSGDPAQEVCSYEYDEELALVLRYLSAYNYDKQNARQQIVYELCGAMQAFVTHMRNQASSES